jgi:pimeloyl-ACP methyl ester carboxylesterase
VPPGDPLERLPDSERALLRLVAWLAACDGHVAPEELELLERLVSRSLLDHHTGGDPEGAANRLLATRPDAAAIPALVTALESPRQRQLLACLGRRMVTCHRSNGEGRMGNPAEQAALEQLLGLLEVQGGGQEARALTDHQLQGGQGSPLLPPLPESVVRLHSDSELRLVTPAGFCPRRLRWQTPLGPVPASLGELGLLGQQRLNAYYAYRPRVACPLWGLLLFPGGGVDFRAYAPIARELARGGLLVVVQHVPFGFALFDHDRALGPEGNLRRTFPQVLHWVVGGHSLGGVAAACYARRQPSDITGLVLWAAFPSPTHSLASLRLPVASLCGSHDGLVPPGLVRQTQHLLPPHSFLVEVPGANHTQFGDYWDGRDEGFVQRGDRPAQISRREQRRLVVEHTHRFITSATANGRP